MTSAKPNILFLQTINPGVCFYRIYQFAQKMAELGLARCRIFPDFDPKRILPPDWERKLNENIVELEAQVDWADIVVCQYINSAEGLAVVQSIRETRPVLMEVDDDFKHVPYQSVAYDGNAPGGEQDLWATRQLQESSGVIVSTPYLVKYFKHYNPNIHCIPNCVDFNLWDSFSSSPHTLLRVGWIGGATHDGDLKLAKDALFHLLGEHSNLEVYIVSAPPPSWEDHERLHLVSKWVTIDQYAEHVKALSFDIGIVPLRDNLFNRGKSNLRGLEYGACSVPFVSSPVEPYRNGLPTMSARNFDEWVAAIEFLIINDEVRRDMGRQAYDYVKQHYNLKDVAVDYANHLKGYL